MSTPVAVHPPTAGPRIQTWPERFLAALPEAGFLSERLLLLVFLTGLVLICGVTAFIGAVPTRMYGHDVFITLELSWRLINGQRPHVDFTSAWGPVWFLLGALGMSISRHSVNGVGYSNAIAALIVGCWSFFLGRNRLASLPQIILGFLLAALVAAPYPLGEAFYRSSHAMVYNRYGYALLGLILLECVAGVRPGTKDGPQEPQEWIGGASTGAALGLALFLKASYFFVGVGLVAVISLLANRIGFRRILGILAGFSLVSLCLLAYLRFDLAAMVRDLRMAAGARAAGITPEVVVVQNTLGHGSILLGVALLAIAAMITPNHRNLLWRGPRLLLVGALIFAADIGLMSTNQQFDAFPLCAVFAVVVMGALPRDPSLQVVKNSDFYPTLHSGALFLALLLFLPQLTSDLAGLAYGALRKARPGHPEDVLRFTTENLRPLLLYDDEPQRSNGRVFTTYVNDGVALLERQSRPDETVLSIDMTNPFPYALERRPPRGGIASPTYNHDIDDMHRPSDDQFFGNADIVMVPKHPALDDGFWIGLYKAYEPGLKQRYYLAAETSWWRMYRRKELR
jgi:hypothetical protein